MAGHLTNESWRDLSTGHPQTLLLPLQPCITSPNPYSKLTNEAQVNPNYSYPHSYPKPIMQADKWIALSQYGSPTTISHPPNPSTLNPHTIRQVKIVTHDNCNHIFPPPPRQQTPSAILTNLSAGRTHHTKTSHISTSGSFSWFHKGHPNHSSCPLPSSLPLLQADQCRSVQLSHSLTSVRHRLQNVLQAISIKHCLNH